MATDAYSFTELPAYTEGMGVGHDNPGASSPAATDAGSVTRIAWVIIIGSLVLLWFLGYTFKS